MIECIISRYERDSVIEFFARSLTHMQEKIQTETSDELKGIRTTPYACAR